MSDDQQYQKVVTCEVAQQVNRKVFNSLGVWNNQIHADILPKLQREQDGSGQTEKEICTGNSSLLKFERTKQHCWEVVLDTEIHIAHCMEILLQQYVQCEQFTKSYIVWESF